MRLRKVENEAQRPRNHSQRLQKRPRDLQHLSQRPLETQGRSFSALGPVLGSPWTPPGRSRALLGSPWGVFWEALGGSWGMFFDAFWNKQESEEVFEAKTATYSTMARGSYNELFIFLVLICFLFILFFSSSSSSSVSSSSSCFSSSSYSSSSSSSSYSSASTLLLHLLHLLHLLIEDAYGESPPPPGIYHLVAGFCRILPVLLYNLT